jgi:hypothetical protein
VGIVEQRRLRMSLLATSSILWQSTTMTTSAFAPSAQFGTTWANNQKTARGLIVKPSHLRLWDNQLQGQQVFDKEGQDQVGAFSMMMVDATTPSTTTYDDDSNSVSIVSKVAPGGR